MKVRYDAEANALYIELRATTVTTKRLDQDIAIDYDMEGHIAGIEILSAEVGSAGSLWKTLRLLRHYVATSG